MTKKELEARVRELEEQNKGLLKMVNDLSSDDEYIDYDEYTTREINMMVAEKLAEEDRKNDERAAEDPDFAWELRQIRYLESRYDDMYGDW